jgi:hypothetical protein
MILLSMKLKNKNWRNIKTGYDIIIQGHETGEYKNYRTYRTPGKDKKGNKIEDTHAILYLGINDNGQFEFLDQWVNKIEKMTIDDFKDKKNLKPRLIIDEPNKDTT